MVPLLQLRFEPELAELDRLLEDDQIFLQIKADLSRRRPARQLGRPSILAFRHAKRRPI